VILEAVGFPETSLRLYQTTQHNIRQDRNICTDMRRITMGIRSEKCVVRRFRRCANIKEFTYTKLNSIAYYTPKLYGIAYCS